MAEKKREAGNGKLPEPVDPDNVTPDGIPAEVLHPDAEVGPSGPAEVEDAVEAEYIRVEDLPERRESPPEPPREGEEPAPQETLKSVPPKS